MSEGIKENLANTAHWLRLLLTAIYALIFVLGVWVLGFVVLLNLLILLVTGERNQNLIDFGSQLADYLAQIMAYATLNSDARPFPFGEWSSHSEQQPEAPPASVAQPAAPSPATPTKKKTAKKTAKKSKKTAKKVAKRPATEGADGENP